MGIEKGDSARPDSRAAAALPHKLELSLLVLILIVAAFLRLWQLDSVPPGLTHDEADTGYFVAAVYRGTPSQVETPYGYANEPFSMYSGALFMAVFGPNDIALRLHSAFFGLVMIVFGYSWVRIAFDAPTALGAAALAAVSFWPVATSRYALNPQPAPALFAGAVWFLWLALFDHRPRRGRWWAWLLFALLLAGSLWAYEVARATTAALLVFGFYLLLTDAVRMRERGLWFAGALALGLVLAAPHLLDAAAWQRSDTLATSLKTLRDGDPGPLFTTAREALGTFTFQGDPFITYGPPGRPIFNWAVGLLFYGGLLLCLRRWRKPARAFTLLWIGFGLLPSMIVGAWNSTLHSMGMQFVVFVPAALFGVEAVRWLGQRYGRPLARLSSAVFVALILWTGLNTYLEYFTRWGQSPDVRAAYFHNLSAVTDYLDNTAYSGIVGLSSPFPDLPHDPFIVDLRVQRDDLLFNWFDARRALVVPPVEQSMMILPSNAPLANGLADWLPVLFTEQVNLHPEDVDPYFDVLLWQPEQAWEMVMARLSPGPVHGNSPLKLPVNFGDTIELVSYDLLTPVVAPGESVTLITAWRVIEPEALGPSPPQRYGRAAAVFVHVLDASGEVVGQEDRLDVPAWNWRTGDRFVQIHSFVPDTALAADTYALQLGIYTRPDLVRLPVLTDDGQVGDYVSLQPVEIRAP